MIYFNWNKYQKMTPEQAGYMNARFYNFFAGVNDVELAQQLTEICDGMSATYDEAIADETTYEIEDEEETVEQIKQELVEKQKEINALKVKQENGTITEEEQARLEELSTDVGDLKTQLKDAISKELFLVHGFQAAVEEQKSVRETALDYADTTIDKGEDLVNEYFAGFGNFFTRFFQSFFENMERNRVGKDAIKSGSNLEAVVKTADVMAEVAKAAAATAEETADTAEVVAENAEEAVQEAEAAVSKEEPESVEEDKRNDEEKKEPEE